MSEDENGGTHLRIPFKEASMGEDIALRNVKKALIMRLISEEFACEGKIINKE